MTDAAPEQISQSYSQAEVSQAEAEEQSVFQQMQIQALTQRVVSLRAQLNRALEENTQLTTQLAEATAPQEGESTIPPEDGGTPPE